MLRIFMCRTVLQCLMSLELKYHIVTRGRNNFVAELPSKLAEITAKIPLRVFPTARLISRSLLGSLRLLPIPAPSPAATLPDSPLAPRRSRPPAPHSSPTPLRSLPHPSYLPINKVTVSLLPPLQSPAKQQGHRLPSAINVAGCPQGKNVLPC